MPRIPLGDQKKYNGELYVYRLGATTRGELARILTKLKKEGNIKYRVEVDPYRYHHWVIYTRRKV